MSRRLLAGLTVLVSLAAAGDASAKPVRWAGNGHLYDVRAVPDGLSWVQAYLRARAFGCGWYLATLTSKAEDGFVRGLVAKEGGIFDRDGGRGLWLGGFQTNGLDEPAGNWRWVTDEAFRFKNWNPGEPNNAEGEGGVGGQNEAFLQLLPDGAWNDVDEFGTTPGKFPRGFVAEFDKGRQAACRKAG
jgi:hypothetical protein